MGKLNDTLKGWARLIGNTEGAGVSDNMEKQIMDCLRKTGGYIYLLPPYQSARGTMHAIRLSADGHAVIDSTANQAYGLLGNIVKKGGIPFDKLSQSDRETLLLRADEQARLHQEGIHINYMDTRLLRFDRRIAYSPEGKMVADENSMIVADMGYFFKEKPENANPPLRLTSVGFKNGLMHSLYLKYDAGGGKSSFLQVPFDNLTDKGRDAVETHMAKFAILSRTEAEKDQEFTSMEKNILSEYARIKGANSQEERNKLFGGLYDSLSSNTRKPIGFSNFTEKARLESTKEHLLKLNSNISLREKTKKEIPAILKDRLISPGKHAFSKEQTIVLSSFLKLNSISGGSNRDLRILMHDAVAGAGKDIPEGRIQEVVSEVEDLAFHRMNPEKQLQKYYDEAMKETEKGTSKLKI